jgi:hypothetical protein
VDCLNMTAWVTFVWNKTKDKAVSKVAFTIKLFQSKINL